MDTDKVNDVLDVIGFISSSIMIMYAWKRIYFQVIA